MRNFLIPIVLVMVAIASFFWYTKPAYNEIQVLRASIKEHDTALSRISEIQQVRDQLLNRYNSLPESSLYVLNKILPDEVNSVRFLIELDQIATKHGLTIQEPEYQNLDEDEESSGAYKTTTVTFTTSGSYGDVLAFIQEVERSARLLDIMELSVMTSLLGGTITDVPSGEMNEYQFIVQIYSLNGLPEKE